MATWSKMGWVVAMGVVSVGCQPDGPEQGFYIPENAVEMPEIREMPAADAGATAVPARQVRAPGTVLEAADFADTPLFDEIKNSDRPVVVDFTATWCGPCQMLKPVLEELEKDGKVKVVMVDVDQYPAIAGSFGVSGIPHLMFVKDGKIAETVIGFQPKEKLESVLSGLGN
jgi:thioredoxin 1